MLTPTRMDTTGLIETARLVVPRSLRAEAPVQLTCEKAVEITTHVDSTDAKPTMDGHDPTALQHIAHVELLSVDGSGFMHQDPGYLTGQVEQRYDGRYGAVS